MYRLSKEEFVNVAPDDIGSVRVNHVSERCSGDSKSLKVERKDDGRIVAKCYRCGGFGVYDGRFAEYRSYAKKVYGKVKRKVNEVKLPRDVVNDICDMPVSVRLDLNKWKIDQAKVNTYGICYSKWSNRLYFPVYREHEFIGYTARNYGDPELPKYITRYKNDQTLWQKFFCGHDTTSVVIAEDMVSAIRVADITDSVAMFGTEIPDDCLEYVAKSYERALIWTDYDNQTVRKKGVKIRDRLTWLGVRAIIIPDKTDPKHYSKEEIQEILDPYMS